MVNKISLTNVNLGVPLALPLLFIVGFASTVPLSAASTAVSGGKNLLQPASARATALGEAFSTAWDDIGGAAYNPAVLSSLKSGQASFLFDKGLADDNSGNIVVGMPTRIGGIGLSLGYYDGGSFDLYDGTSERTVKAQSDYLLTGTYARKVRSGLDLGFSGKYISSQLGESAKAQAFAMDLGVNYNINSQLRSGLSVQNLGTTLKYESEAESLPRVMRAGLSALLVKNKYAPRLSMEVPYYVNEEEIRPAVGLETSFGPFAFRMGYQSRVELNNFSFGLGFMTGPLALNYSFSMVQSLDNVNRVNVVYRFRSPGLSKQGAPPVWDITKSYEDEVSIAALASISSESYQAKDPANSLASDQASLLQSDEEIDMTQTITFLIRGLEETSAGYIYPVQEGDTYASVALKAYGTKAMAWRIYNLNKNKFPDPKVLPVGKTIILPKVGKDISPVAIRSKPSEIGVNQVYEVKENDTWQSISMKVYGTPNLWKYIYLSNQHLVDSPQAALVKGTKVVLPK